MVSVVRFDRQQNTAGTLYYHVVQVVATNFTAGTTFTTANAYQTLNGGSVSITPVYSGSKFKVFVNLQGYTTTSNGVNAGISRTISGTTTRVAGQDGTGDTWGGSSNGIATNSVTLHRHYIDSPGVSAGVVITYNALAGLWSSGQFQVNYTGAYNIVSNITVWELQP